MHYSVWSEQEEDEGRFIYKEEENWGDTSNDLLLPDYSFFADRLKEYGEN